MLLMASAHGTEVLYVTQQTLAAQLSSAIASCGFTNRGAKYRSDLYVLNNTEMPAVLLGGLFLRQHRGQQQIPRRVRPHLRRHCQRLGRGRNQRASRSARYSRSTGGKRRRSRNPNQRQRQADRQRPRSHLQPRIIHESARHRPDHHSVLLLVGGLGGGGLGIGYGYGLGHGGVGIIGVILIIVIVLLLLGRL